MTAATHPQDLTLEQRVEDARVRMLYLRNQIPACTGLAFALLICWFLWSDVDHRWLAVWLLLRFFAVAVRTVLYVAYRRTARPEDAGQWARRYVAVIALDAISWCGLMVWFAPPDRVDLAAVMAASTVGVAAVAAVLLSMHLAALLTFQVVLLVPGVAVQLLQGGDMGYFAAIGSLIFLGILIMDGRKAVAATIELLTLRFHVDEVAEQRAQALQLAERHSAVKSQFLATMSHEMRTPLHGMLGTLRGLKDDARPPQERRQLDLMERAGEHLLGLINDVLDFSRIEAGQLEVQRAPYDPKALLHDVIELAATAAAAKGLALRIDADQLPAQWNQGDAARVRQILINLVGNAVKFTERGEVAVTARIAGDRLRVTVEDSGIGIAAEDLPRIFEPFRQVDSSYARRFAGTGLGLSISRELARAMGGEITCRSTPGRGSLFLVDLPWEACDPPFVKTQPMEASPAAVGLAGKVLLADDNPVNLLVAQGMLEKLGIEVAVATDGARALELYLTGRPDVVLMDCHMPVMDGFDATRRIREEEARRGWKRVPIIAVTANALQGDRERCIDAGMDDHLPKPFRKEDLHGRLAPWLAAA